MTYILNNANNIRTTKNNISHANLCMPADYPKPAVIAVVRCEECKKEGDELVWSRGRTLCGVLTDLDSEDQIKRILDRGRDANHLKEILVDI